MSDAVERLRSIKTFPQLVKYLRDELDWPIESDDVEDLTFEYEAEELGIHAEHAVKIKDIKQLRPLDSKQPWGIFWINFEKKRLPMVVLRRILGNLVVKKRASAKKGDRPRWQLNDLLFISSYGEEEHRTISFAHFAEDPDVDELPVLRVLGWDDQNSIMHLDRVANRLQTNLRWPDEKASLDAWRQTWSEAFTDRYQEAIRSANELIPQLAALARAIRNRVEDTLKAESERGPMRKLLDAVRGLLIHDMDEKAFADMYAQTVAYGLLSARFSRPAGLTAQNLVQLTAVSNPFLENLLESLFRLNRGKFHFDVDEIGINDVLDLLRRTNIEAIKAAFNDQNPAEDPVIRFYEGFLKEYDPRQRIQRGIFFTPRPVVSYIVRSVHELLQIEFGLEDGLASTATWSDVAKKFPDLKLPKDVKPSAQFVLVLDPAVGTGTFLFECIEVVERTMKDKWCREVGVKSWNEPEILRRWRDYVPKHLLTRLYGYELMMAPYAIAHLKLALKLGETGYQFHDGDRLHIYLTNSLEPPSEHADPKFANLFATLAKEAQEVNDIKRRQWFTVIIGNPPYSGLSANLTDTARSLVARFKFIDGVKLKERGALQLEKNLQDDYIKFLAFAEDRLNASAVGVCGMICNHGFIDNRGVRWSLINNFRQIWVLDLHGNVNRGERTPDGSDDQNVFDIKDAGVAIFLGSKGAFTTEDRKRVRKSDLWGDRETQKYPFLVSNTVKSHPWETVEIEPDFFLFRMLSRDGAGEYSSWPKVTDVFPLHSIGIITARDSYVIDFEVAPIVQRAKAFRESKLGDEATCKALGIPIKKGWNIGRARERIKPVKDLVSCVKPLLYRPFDVRPLFYHESLIWGMAWPVMQHMVGGKNLALITSRMTKGEDFHHVLVSNTLSEVILLSSKTSNNAFVFPLYLSSAMTDLQLGGRTNLSSKFLEILAEKLELPREKPNGLPQGLTPEDIFHYTYAVFHTSGYRRRYVEFLKIDFPRLPLTSNRELFRSMARLGNKLIALHLLESPNLGKNISEFVGGRNPEVEKITYARKTVWLDIVVALNETIRLMAEIDKVIEKHGGWPGAFVTSSEEKTQVDTDLPMAAEPSASYSKAEL